MKWPTINPGELRHPISLIRFDPAPDDASGATTAESVFTTAMASIEGGRGTDVIVNGQTVTQYSLVLKLWFQPGVTADMQVKTESGARYVIQAIDNVLEMNLVLVLICLSLGGSQQ